MIRRPPRSTLFPTRRSSDLPCLARLRVQLRPGIRVAVQRRRHPRKGVWGVHEPRAQQGLSHPGLGRRSEEHTSELQSRQYLVCRLLLEKKKKKQKSCRTRQE